MVELVILDGNVENEVGFVITAVGYRALIS
jgi:hypothetical protein